VPIPAALPKRIETTAAGRVGRPAAHGLQSVELDVAESGPAEPALRARPRIPPAATAPKASAATASQIPPRVPPPMSTIPPNRTVVSARLLTPTSLRINVSPVGPAPQVVDAQRAPAPASRSTMPPRSVARSRSRVARAEELVEAAGAAEPSFDAVEIVAREAGRLLDIATLRRESEQYVLGHKTPQGKVAPHKLHTGLRLLRISDDREVDLVFPRDVAGHLVRGAETVALRELTLGRKYSCLRLKPQDVVTVILGEGAEAVSYHIRFIRAPRFARAASSA
jgi:hypothetical protein